MHSRTVQQYDLAGAYSRLRSRVGLQAGEGDQGAVVVRVLGDGAVLYEQSLSGGRPAESLELDVSRLRTLQLEVDFGDNFDVGDHVTWGDPVLIRPTP